MICRTISWRIIISRKAERLYPPKNPKDVHFFYNSWGNVYSSQEKPAEALKCFLKAQKATRQMEQPLATAIVDANLGQTYLELNRLDSAQKYLTLYHEILLCPALHAERCTVLCGWVECIFGSEAG